MAFFCYCLYKWCVLRIGDIGGDSGIVLQNLRILLSMYRYRSIKMCKGDPRISRVHIRNIDKNKIYHRTFKFHSVVYTKPRCTVQNSYIHRSISLVLACVIVLFCFGSREMLFRASGENVMARCKGIINLVN